ncbi:iron-sulfur cluster repair di-iron protein, ric [Aerococcaceae bacterium DSM 111022]|nr:iron-sulfur cluster repair di-iron protein, ric [Aerococcaceae bacterium DSM 111022]
MALKEYLTENQEKLDLYTTAITRAHGKNHPEAFAVRDLYTELEAAVFNDKKEKTTRVFKELRQVTSNYEMPNDVCETYEATFHMLEKMDQLQAIN